MPGTGFELACRFAAAITGEQREVNSKTRATLANLMRVILAPLIIISSAHYLTCLIPANLPENNPHPFLNQN